MDAAIYRSDQITNADPLQWRIMWVSDKDGGGPLAKKTTSPDAPRCVTVEIRSSNTE